MPAFFAALCFAVLSMFALSALDEFTESTPTADSKPRVSTETDALAPVAVNHQPNRKGS